MPHALTTEHDDPLLAALADRLRDFAPRATFPEVYAVFRDLAHAPGRNTLYATLRTLDGSLLVEDGLIVRIADHERASRRSVLIRPRRSWEAQRDFLARFRAHGGKHPPRPISYRTAHARVRDARGPASAHFCEQCGDRAAEWAYRGFGLDEQAGWVTSSVDGVPEETLRLWSPNPADYDPLCRRCHWEYDELGLAWPDAPRTPKPAPPTANLADLPADAPAWLRAMAPEAASR